MRVYQSGPNQYPDPEMLLSENSFEGARWVAISSELVTEYDEEKEDNKDVYRVEVCVAYPESHYEWMGFYVPVEDTDKPGSYSWKVELPGDRMRRLRFRDERNANARGMPPRSTRMKLWSAIAWAKKDEHEQSQYY